MKVVRDQEAKNRWKIKQGKKLLYIATLDRANRVFQISPVSDTLEYIKILDGPWQEKTAGQITDTEHITLLDSIRVRCLPFPNVGDCVLFPDLKTGKPVRGIVLEVHPLKRGGSKALVGTKSDDRTGFSIHTKLLFRPDDEIKAIEAAVRLGYSPTSPTQGENSEEIRP